MKRTIIITLFAVSALLLVVLSCTMPIYIVTNPTSESSSKDEETSTPTLTPTVTETPAATYTPTYAVTPTVSVSLDGPWTIWEGTSQKMLDIDFLQDGYNVTANVATDDGQSLLFEGVISYDGTSVSGTWKMTSGVSGNFVMYLDASYSTFSGNLGGGVPFCGNRNSSSKPATCLQ
jgi:hypothetical protein